MEKRNKLLHALWHVMCSCVASHKQTESHGNKTSISCLPDDLVIDILSRVPAQTVLACKAVCKSWYRLTDTVHFTETHLSRATPVILGLAFGFTGSEDVWFSTNNFSLEPRLNKVTANGNDLVRRFHDYPFFVSCNGLFIFGGATVPDWYVICNPVTREETTLELRKNDVIFGFYFHQLEKEYKLLIYQKNDTNKFSVYGLSTKLKTILFGNSIDITNKHSPGTVACGALFWRYDTNYSRMMMFDLETETFEVKHQPTEMYKREGRFDRVLYEIEGKLWWCDVSAKSVQVWILEDTKTWKWVKRYVVDLSGFFIRENGDGKTFDIVGIQKGNMLLFQPYGELFWCNLQQNKVRKINKRSGVRLRGGFESARGIQWMSTLVSLGDLNILPRFPRRKLLF